MELTPHNPQQFDSEQIGTCEGYRLLNYEEFARALPEDLQSWSERSKKWVKCKAAGMERDPGEVSYRTRTLEPRDIEFWESNPEDYDDDHIERHNGWRPLQLGELAQGVDKPDDLQYYDDDEEEWSDASQAGTDDYCYDDITYRTQSTPPMNPHQQYMEYTGDLISDLAKLLGG